MLCHDRTTRSRQPPPGLIAGWRILGVRALPWRRCCRLGCWCLPQESQAGYWGWLGHQWVSIWVWCRYPSRCVLHRFCWCRWSGCVYLCSRCWAQAHTTTHAHLWGRSFRRDLYWPSCLLVASRWLFWIHPAIPTHVLQLRTARWTF